MTARFPAFALPGLLLGLVMLGSPAEGQERGRAGCEGPWGRDRIRQVSALGEMVLESGRTVGLAGIRLPEDEAARGPALAWLRAREGRAVLVRAYGPPDRWDRQPSALATGDGPGNGPATSPRDPPEDFATALVRAGLALVDAGVAETHCAPDLLVAEAQARERSLGIWDQDRYKPLDAAQRDGLRERAGTFVLVEGRVRSVGERPQTTYLNFGGAWAEDFTIIISKKTWTRLTERGLTPDSLRGRRVRARGVLEAWQGTALRIRAPEMIERIEDRSPGR
ncbi:MAG: DNA-binding protein [Microvirga sp.]